MMNPTGLKSPKAQTDRVLLFDRRERHEYLAGIQKSPICQAWVSHGNRGYKVRRCRKLALEGTPYCDEHTPKRKEG